MSGKTVFRTITPMFDASKVVRSYRETGWVSAAEIAAAQDKLNRARHQRISSEMAEIFIRVIPGAPVEKTSPP